MKTKNLTQKLNFFELVGIIIGDESIWNYPDKGVYGLEITGNADDDNEYFLKISNFIEKIINKKPRIAVKYERLGKSLKLVVYSKDFVKYLIDEVGITNIDKTFNVAIPEKYMEWKYSQHVLRGIFETDGCLYFSKSGGIIHYPRIEIKTSSIELAKQITFILKQNNFKPYTRTSKSDKTTAIYLSGPIMLEKWHSEIGFGNAKNLSKYLFWKKFGYYMPRISLKKRLDMLELSARVAKRPIIDA